MCRMQILERLVAPDFTNCPPVRFYPLPHPPRTGTVTLQTRLVFNEEKSETKGVQEVK